MNKNTIKKAVMTTLALSLMLQPIVSQVKSSAAGETYKVTLHKLISEKDIELKNTGKELKDLQGAIPYNKAKYGDVEFSIFKLTKPANGYAEESPEAVAKAVSEDNTKYGATEVSSDVVDENGKIVKDLEKGDYVIIETKHSSAVTQVAKAIFLSLPMTNAEGNGYEKDIHLYPKNKVQSISFTLVKQQSNKNEANTLLEGATFNLYKGERGKGIKVGGDLKTNKEGKIVVTDLEVGDYYFVETASANDKLISKYYLNDANNQLGFKVTTNGEVRQLRNGASRSLFGNPKMERSNPIVNYEKPEFRKDITGFPEDINQVVHNYDENEAIPFDLKTYVPKDIKDYQEFKISDVPDKSVEIDKSTINVKVGETTLEKDKDYELVTEKLDGNKAFEVKLKISNELAKKIAGKEIIVNYKAKITDKAEMNKVLENTAELNYNNGVTADKIQDKEQIETYGKKFVKKDAGLWGTTLLGEGGLKDAHFRLEKENKGNWEIVEKFKDVVSKDDGSFEIKGLKEGKYRLVETKAPEGFRLPDGDDAITEFTLDAKSKDANNAAVNIKNSKDTPLPVTGLDAMGYTVVATVGLLGVAIVTKKKKAVNA